MPIIKLDATPSTNDFLKDLAASTAVEPYTVVTAEKQTKGRGQRGESWESEPGKNLTFSIFVPDSVASAHSLFLLNIATALSISDVLESIGVPRILVKWPNDILSGNRKLCGILIENSIGNKINSVIGIGINVNQRNFDGLPTATSLYCEMDREFDRDTILERVVESVKLNIEKIGTMPDDLWRSYHDRLFMMGRAALFETPDAMRFMAVVKGVTSEGKLLLETEDGARQSFGIKEVKLIY